MQIIISDVNNDFDDDRNVMTLTESKKGNIILRIRSEEIIVDPGELLRSVKAMIKGIEEQG